MKRYARTIYFTLALLVLFIVACEKYSDKLLFNLQSKPERIARNWMVARATINGRDVTTNYEQFLLKLTEKGDANLFAKFKQKQTRFEYKTIGKWFLMNNQNKILLDFENNDADVVYHILKINENEIWLKKEDESLELHFISQ